ncbi:DUF5709 domain-containing protein [Micropruina sonneratiae]|uniref:DUF5709 domain-containing protein n=1 Tax=Micropruina sonneratiae TaxID=2986940 RepID=UPI002227FD45|nr:DUF5709 domain-containing protein [Micropruina sp. KQZ13P-5]MCW3158458.1 DUF5709 domain-containing protein [Micropruina sp. KQZ13P-5]
MTDFDPTMPDESEQLDQLQSDDSLIDRGVDDVLDEGYVAPEKWSAAQTFGNTAAEMRHGETLDQRMAQEEPEGAAEKPKWTDESDGPREVGSKRAGRLVDAEGGYDATDVEPESIGRDVGFAGGAASAEEAAMHIIDDYEDDDDD